MGIRDEFFSTSLSRVSVKTLMLAKDKYDRARNEQKIEQLQPFTYQPLTKVNAIRLLKIKDGLEQEAIDCDVFEVSLDDNPAYEALSYTWQMDQTFSDDDGKSKEPKVRAIRCNGKLFKVQMNLYHALAQFRRSRHALPIWVDSICIDQNDEIHKHQQLEIMGRIYSSAQRVIIWLGKSTTIHELAIGIMSKLAQSKQNDQKELSRISTEIASMRDTNFRITYGKALNKDGNADAAERSRIDQHADALAVLRILRRGWFTRTWTLQELLLAKEVAVVMGPREIPPEAIVNATRWLLKFYSTDVIGGLYMDDLVSHYRHLLAIPAFFNSREQFLHGRRWSFEEYAAVVRTRGVTDPKDKVYAGYSLLNQPLPHLIGTTAEVYSAFAQALYQSEAGLSAFSLVGDLRSTIPDLPSWVPDLCISIRPKPLRYTTDHVFQAATTMANIPRCSFDSPALVCQAAIWDTVEEVAETDWSWNYPKWTEYAYSDSEIKSRYPNDSTNERLGRMFPLVAALGKLYQPTEEPTIAVLCHTLLAGLYSNGTIPPDVVQSFSYYLTRAVAAVQYMAQDPSGLVARGYTLGRKAHTSQEESLDAVFSDIKNNLMTRFEPFMNLLDSSEYPLKDKYSVAQAEVQEALSKVSLVSSKLYNIMRDMFQDNTVNDKKLPFMALFEERYEGRRLFVTKRGYMGVGVESTKKGDSVVLAPGADVPYIFRPVEGQENTFLLIGESYVHGVMQGEAVKNKDLDLRTVRIV